MAQLVTQAHRVSSIHARYSKIHSALFSISPFKKKSLRGDKADTIYSEFEAELSEMAETLSEIGATIRDSAELDPNTSYSRKFAVILQQYIEELSTSIIRVLQICKQRHRSKLGKEAYDSDQSREDLTKYDESIQNHKRLGIKLNRMAPRL